MSARVHFRKDRGAWEVRIYRGGREWRRSFGPGPEGERRARACAERELAEDRLREEWRREHEAEYQLWRAERVPRKAIPVDDALRLWLRSERARLSRSYEETAEGLIRNHLQRFFGSRDLASLERSDLLGFAAWMAERGKGPATTANALSLLRRVAQAEVEAGRLTRNPLANVGRLVAGVARRQAREVRQVEAFTAAELAVLFETAREVCPWIAPLLVFLAATGARLGEALGLQRGDVDLERGVVHIRRARVRGCESTTKTGRARQVPLEAAGGALRAVLAERLAAPPGRGAGRELVFLGPGGRPLGDSNVKRAWRRVAAAAEIRGVRPLRLHDLRHSFASHALAAGVAVPLVAAWLGHSSPSTTLGVYAHAIPPRPEQLGFLEGAFGARAGGAS